MLECQDLLCVRWGLLSVSQGGMQTPPLVTASNVLLILTMTCPINTGVHTSFHIIASCMCTQHNKIIMQPTITQPPTAICITDLATGRF